jgi:acyl-CoA synthetase (AMP-forming)/AMP-acid ligase II
VGEVVVKGDSVMAGYWRNPEATAAAVRDGWLFTGDVGCLDADGFLTLKDRSKDLIISGGSNIYPREVEEVLLTAPGVAEVAVVGMPDAEWGEVVVAFVVPQTGAALTTAESGRALPGADGALQATQALPAGGCLAQKQLRQGAENRAARAVGRTQRVRSRPAVVWSARIAGKAPAAVSPVTC